jgi:hypothetical protein
MFSPRRHSTRRQRRRLRHNSSNRSRMFSLRRHNIRHQLRRARDSSSRT